MLRILMVFVFLGGVSSLDAAFAQQDALVNNPYHNVQWGDEEREVWRVIEEWNAAFSRNDVNTYFGFVDDEITVLVPGNPYRVEGIFDDREEFEFGVAKGYSRVSLFHEMQPLVVVKGDMAFVSYFNSGYYGPEGGGKMIYLKETDVLVKRDDGWKIIHIHVSD